MAQPIELAANITNLNFESPYAELEAPSQPTVAAPQELEAPSQPAVAAPQELINTGVGELESHHHESDLIPQSQSWVEIKDLIVELERQTLEAYTLPDNTVFNTYLAPKAKIVSSEGVVSNAVSIDWQRWRSPKMSDEFVLRVAQGVVIIYYKLKVEPYHHRGWPFKQVRTSTWRKEEGEDEWKMIFHQCTVRK